MNNEVDIVVSEVSSESSWACAMTKELHAFVTVKYKYHSHFAGDSSDQRRVDTWPIPVARPYVASSLHELELM